MVSVNCGIDALLKVTKLKNISMFTLIHLAKDNGLDFYFCRVDEDKIPLVVRPAILHSDEHFTLIKDGEAIPEGKYSGWVLTPKPMGVPLPYSLAKQITGGKKGGWARSFIPTILGFVSNLIIPGSGLLIGAASNIGMDQYAKSNHPEQLGQPGQPLDILGAGLAGAASGAASQGAIAGFKGASNLAGSTLGSKIGGAATGALTGIMHPIASNPLFGSNAAGLFPGGASGAANAASGIGQTGTGSTGALSGGTQPAMSLINGSTGNAAGQQLTAQNLATNSLRTTMTNPSSLIPASVSSGGSTAAKTGIGSIFGGDTGKTLLKAGAGLIAGQIGKPPAYEPDSMAQFDKASQYLQGAKLPSATNQQLNKYLGMSINDIKSDLTNPNAANSALLELDKKYQSYLADVQRGAAQAGQSIETSSDARKQYDEVNRQWADARANLQAQLDQSATQQAVGIKQWALEQSLQQGQVDMHSALELAAMVGRDEELKQTIARDDYEGFQKLIQELLSMGEGSAGANKGGTTININGANVGLT